MLTVIAVLAALGVHALDYSGLVPDGYTMTISIICAGLIISDGLRHYCPASASWTFQDSPTVKYEKRS